MTVRWIIGCAAFIVALNVLVETTHARPKYKSAFESLYPKISKDNKISCTVCHGDESKKKRNHYGEALAKELDATNVTDSDKIKKALQAIESGECKTGKWKDRLDAGKAPCEDRPDKHEFESYISRQLNRSTK